MDDRTASAPDSPAPRGRLLRAQDVLVPALLLAATVAAGQGLYHAQRNALALEILHSRLFPALRASLFLAALAPPAAVALWVARGRGLRSLAPLRVLFYILTLGHVALVAAVENFERIYFDLALGLLGGVYAGLLIVGLALGRYLGIARKGLRVLDFLLFQVCALLVVCELLLRLLAVVAPSPLLTLGETGPQKYIETYQLEPKSLRYGKSVNATGHYDDEFTQKEEGETLVVSIGDSFSVGIVPWDFLYTTLAERSLEGVRLHNFGVVACGPREYLFLLRQHGLVYKPDAVLINLYIGNDFLIREEENADNLFLRSWCDRKSLMSTLR